MERGEDIILPQFDPNFFSPDKVQCRSFHCPEKKARSSCRTSKMNKEDLYLCRYHQQKMINFITEQCDEREVKVNFKDFKDEDFYGYTSLIGLLEKTFQHFKKKASRALFPAKIDLFLAEIFLNVRNFLIITNTLLNPDRENRHNILTAIITIFQSFMEHCNDRQYVENCVYLLRQIMETILLPFRVIYTWVTLPFQQNPGAQIGAGIGSALGAAGAVVMFGRASTLPIALGSAIGLLGGGLVGGGIFNLCARNLYRHENNHHRDYTGSNVYVITGSPDGDLFVELEHLLIT